ncbi:MAG: alpha-ketoacid dehydrogenase subunit beta [Clostridiales bacterium]|nr:alpha-ketoacid dehydrogenase subunit beta [Clostridiales bacterium]
MPTMGYNQAIDDAIKQEMRRDPTVFIAGEDVRCKGKAFLDEFGPKRVINMPISEAQIIALGVGASAMGLRPVLAMSFMDFLGVCMDEIINQAAKMSYMLGGQTHLPMTIHANMGAGIRAAAQHSQSFETVFAHFPGLKVAIPSCPVKAKGLMSQAIRDDDPVLLLDHKRLGGMEADVPDGAFALPFGKADIVREGKDITLVTWGYMVHDCLAAAETLAGQGVSAEVIDIVSLTPFDEDTILASAVKTGRVVIAHEATLHAGFGGEIAARIADKAFYSLKKPVKRVGAPFMPVPFSPVLEDIYLPGAESVLKAALEIL